MHIKDFDNIKSLMEIRGGLLRKLGVVIQSAQINSGLGITIEGTYQSDAMVDEIRPYIILVLRRQISDVTEKLNEYGVATDGMLMP